LEWRYLGDAAANIVGKRLTADEYMILAIAIESDGAPSLYRRRWEIETPLAPPRLRSFDLKTTLARPKRISKLIGLPSLALVWIQLIVQWRAESEGRPVAKSHGYPVKSLFRCKLYHLQTTVLSPPQRHSAFLRCNTALAPSSQLLLCG